MKTPSAAGFELDSDAHITPVLRSMMENATNNIGKGLKRRRHTVIMIKFATLLYINAGSMAYNFIHRNIPEALPSLRTIPGIVQSQYQPFYEGYFHFDELIIHLKKHNAPLLVTVSEDATQIIKSVEYDLHTNRCVGFVLPSAVNGQVNADAFTVTLFEDIERYFAQNEIAKYAYVYTVQPLKEGIPSFCLACVGTDNKFTNEGVLRTWKYIQEELTKRGVTILNFAADGDSRLLKAMTTTFLTPLDQPLNNGKAVHTSLLKKWLLTQIFPTSFCVQDIVHIGVKLNLRVVY